MFENILGQSATDRLGRDLAEGLLAPAMLFAGPPASGKGSAALELGRILSCENNLGQGQAPWNCGCSACVRHRLLIHPDLLLLGAKPFSVEIAAAAATFLRDAGSLPARMLFIRSLRKLLVRFSPVLWEDDPKLPKISPLVSSLEEALDEFQALTDRIGPEGSASGPSGPLEKLCGSILKEAARLEGEGISDSIPISQIRRAAWWSRFAPAGKAKLIVIENADRMQEGGRNSLLKLLEEPPARVSLTLTSVRPGALLPTILSRLRPYRFQGRTRAVEREVIRRVFRGTLPEASPQEEASAPAEGKSLINAWLDAFQPVNGEALQGLAAFFSASVAYNAISQRRRRGFAEDPPALVLTGKYTAPLGEDAGLGRPLPDSRGIAEKILKGTDNFSFRPLFFRFLESILNLVSQSFRLAPGDSGLGFSPDFIACYEIWKRYITEAASAVGVYNQSPALALERRCSGLGGSLAEVA